MKRLRWWALLGGLSCTALAWAQSAPAENDEVTRLLEEYRQREEKFFADQSPEQSDLSRQPANEYRPKFRALAEKYAGRPEALPALKWLTTKAWGSQEDVTWALAALARDHAGRPEIGEVLKELQYLGFMLGEAPVQQLYDAVLAQNKDREVLARAMYQKGALLSSEWPPLPKPSAERQKEALELFRSVLRDYADTKIAKWAEGAIFEIEKLQVGMPAPEFVGQDAEGKEIRLSDYRGRVVVLAFWGHW